VDTDQFMDEGSENCALERNLADFWDLEAIGISLEEKSVYERLNQLPWSVTQFCPTITHSVKED